VSSKLNVIIKNRKVVQLMSKQVGVLPDGLYPSATAHLCIYSLSEFVPDSH